MSSKLNKVLWIAFGGLVIAPVFIGAAVNAGKEKPSGSASNRSDNNALTSSTDASPAPIAETPTRASNPMTIAEASDEEKRFITQSTLDMKNAADAVGAMINLSGYLCSEVFYVEPTDGGQYFVDCIKHKGRDIKVRYIVDGASGTARPI